MKELALKVGGIILLFISFLHLVRLVLKVEVVVGGFVVPLWGSIIGLIVSFALSLWMLRAAK